MNRLETIEGQNVRAGRNRVGLDELLDGFWIDETLLYDVARESPLTADANTGQATVAQHPVNRRPINFEEFLELFGREEIVQWAQIAIC